MSNIKNYEFKNFDFSKTIDTNISPFDVIEKTLKVGLPQIPKETAWIYEPVVQYLDQILAAKENPDKMVYLNFSFPPEIVQAMGYIPFSHEPMPLIMPTEYFCALIDEGREMGMPDHFCGFVAVGLAPFLKGLFPKPKAILCCSQPCDSVVTWNGIIAESFPDLEIFSMDNPYADDEDALHFAMEQLREGFQYMERMTGKKLDIDRFREVMDYSAQAYRLLHEISQCRTAIPCPLPNNFILRLINLSSYTLTGTKRLVTWLEKHLADAQERIKKGIGGLYEEKIRILWNSTLPIFDNKVYDWMAETFGAVIVSMPSAHPLYQPPDIDYHHASFDELLRCLALRTNNNAMARYGRGHMKTFTQDTLSWCRYYRADAVVFSGSWQCKYIWASSQITKEKLMEELGIPMLSMMADMLDPRVVSAEGMASRLEPFLQMVAEKKGIY